MTLNEIKDIARIHNIKAGKVKKSELVRSIQHAEGNEQCFESGKASHCGQDSCLWRADCT